MGLKDILLHIDNSLHCKARIDLAIRLAKQHQAHLTGLYIVPPFPPGSRQERVELMTSEAKASFCKKTASSGVDSEWICQESFNMIKALRLHAFYRDMIIVGQNNPKCKNSKAPSDLPEQLVFETGRPVLIVPYIGEFKHFGERAMVAWRGGRESVRAINDALSFLKKAHHISVFTANVDGVHGDEVSCPQICSHLAYHGIEATAEKISTQNILLGDTLLNRACDQGFDLMVLGAFHSGHPGLVGPVARHILDHMTIPILMSH